eukprot:CAMPEP_0202505466 /NCGR_PEP_ID=MMETSP1361-20130828/47339_1 /ASSEMBLY_ACC=CAM_ASM_000849 /TAXON_ID=210615 /ORGANISM="Staurosira complex sp., Strain CCMP2646" /LENGTH=40 /DNA_ID= /DNA_START= /DNA_END= /DNA_ORIENTATION=
MDCPSRYSDNDGHDRNYHAWYEFRQSSRTLADKSLTCEGS